MFYTLLLITTRLRKYTNSHAFNNLFDIEKIDISHNSIEEIDDQSFKNLPKLEIVDLSFNNKLQPFQY